MLASLSPALLRTAFPLPYFQKGLSYYKNNHVIDVEVKRNINTEDEITAIVYGSNEQSYHVKVHISSGAGGRVNIYGICSCPMRKNCKHVVAAIFEALDDIKSPQIQVQSQITQPILAIKPPRDPKVDDWMKKLAHITAHNTSNNNMIDTSFSLRYILSATSYNQHELCLKLVLARQLKVGGFGQEKDYGKSTYSNQRYLYPIDKELIANINAANEIENHTTYYDRTATVQGALFEKLLPEIIATHRCHWVSSKNPPITLGDTQQSELNWKTDQKGFQKLEFEFQHKNNDCRIFPIMNTWYLNTAKNHLGILTTGLDADITKILLSAPVIPPEEAEAVANVFIQNSRLSTIKQPKLLIETNADIKTLTPTFCLRLCQTSVPTPGTFDWYHPTMADTPVATLTFDYQHELIPWGDTKEIIHQTDGQHFSRFSRDKIAENNAIKELAQLGLVSIGSILGSTTQAQNAKWLHYFLVGYAGRNPFDFSMQALPLLKSRGWKIEIDANYPYQIIDEPIEDWYSTIDDSAGYDWFNLELGITVNNEKINLLPVLSQLLKKFNVSDRTQFGLTKTESILAQLPDGRYIPLPVERIQNILSVLIELYDTKSLDNGNFLHLSKLQAARLLELEAAMGATKLRWIGGDKLLKMAEKLSQFTQIEPVSIPKEFQGELRGYQHDGLNWMQFLREYELSGILADDMGLGKTVQALAHLSTEKACGRMNNPSLIVAPTSLMFNWKVEAERFAPHLKILVLHGSNRKSEFENISQYDLIFTTYPLLKHDKEILIKQDFYFLILDEAQYIKNSTSLSAQIASQLKASHRLCLTGTPLENHLGELWSLFHFMMPGLLGEEKQFNRLFRTPIEKHNDQDRRQLLIRRIKPFLLRRTKNNVVKELPDKVNMIRQAEIEGAQRDLYETIRVTMQKKVRQEIAKLGLARSHIIILDALLKLRQICCDPRLLKIESPQKNKAKSAKLTMLMSLLPELIEEGRRILLFSQFTEMLELIEDELQKEKISYVKLTGQTKDRATPVQQFQHGDVPLFLISLKAGGTGLNLTAADTVIHYDPWWNPAVEDQATDRAHRIGQYKTVFVYKLVTKGTVEEKILEMQENKRALMEGLFSDNPSQKLNLSEKDLQAFFEPLEGSTVMA